MDEDEEDEEDDEGDEKAGASADPSAAGEITSVRASPNPQGNQNIKGLIDAGRADDEEAMECRGHDL